MTITWSNKPTMSILVFFYYHLPKQTITHNIILNSINLFPKILYDNSSSRFTPNSIYQTSLDGWMLNAKYNKHEEWCFIGFLNTKMLFWKQIPFLVFYKNWFMMDKTKVRGLLKDDVDEFCVIYSLVWFSYDDPSGACQQHKSLSSVFHVSKFVYSFFCGWKPKLWPATPLRSLSSHDGAVCIIHPGLISNLSGLWSAL